MQLTINGKAREVGSPSSLADLVSALKLDMRLAALELNRTIVPKSAYGNTSLIEGDAIELVTFIGGG